MAAAPIADGGAAAFDLNGAAAGQNISHVAGSADISISATGTYYVEYSATVAPTSATSLPATNIVTFALNGQTVAAGAGTAQFTASSPARQVTASAIINVADPPAVLRVISSGGQFIYSAANINIFKI